MSDKTAKNLIEADYRGFALSFTEDGWFNATAAAARFGKLVHEWIRLDSTKDYIAALEESTENAEAGKSRIENSAKFAEVRNSHFVKTRKGGDVAAQGTWLHPDLAVAFARWLDVRFAIWCDRQIKAILTNSHPHFDWRAARIEAASGFSVMSEVLRESREDQGKETKFYHYANEALMLNKILTGVHGPVDRNALSAADLRLLCRMERKNVVLIGRDYPYAYRKSILERFAAEERAKLVPQVGG